MLGAACPAFSAVTEMSPPKGERRPSAEAFARRVVVLLLSWSCSPLLARLRLFRDNVLCVELRQRLLQFAGPLGRPVRFQPDLQQLAIVNQFRLRAAQRLHQRQELV